jgi:hypothetical protein
VSHLRSSLVLALCAIAFTAPANADCQKLAFSVNDYGKEGPTRDAQALLDKYVVRWTTEQGIKKYTVGKKDVTCELFLDVGLFNEHTCKATADVCWGQVSKNAHAAAQIPGKTPAPKQQ